jgi:hypothetical protein
MLSISAVAEKSIAVVLVHALNDLFAHTGFAVLLAEDRHLCSNFLLSAAFLKPIVHSPYRFWFSGEGKKTKTTEGNDSRGRLVYWHCHANSPKMAAKKAGREKYHARPLGSRIGWRENESRKARVNRSCGE